MALIRIQNPLAQPEGRLRLLDQISTNLQSSDFTEFYIITAFAKEGPLLKLKPQIDAWNAGGKTIQAIFGIDEKGTSTEALKYAINNFNRSYIAKITGGIRSTFHPKTYIFNGPSRTVAFIGSNNLTPGGLETNAESYVMLDLQLPADHSEHIEVMNCWTDTLRVCLQLDLIVLNTLIQEGKVISELQMRVQRSAANVQNVRRTTLQFPGIRIVAPTPLPRNIATPPVRAGFVSGATGGNRVTAILNATNVSALVLQIVPHHNGEIFLSKIALNQNPAFFGYPFSGRTVPKIASNPSYPQRSPDPIVNLFIYDVQDRIIYQSLSLALNTVFYTTKSDIRITITPSVAQTIAPLSLLVMETSTQAGLDYELHIYHPGSAEYQNFLTACNQQMPSGGSGSGRRFGWI